MGRRRKHDGDSGLTSDQIPGHNQNNIRSGLVTFYCITTRPFAVIHNGTVPYNPGKSKHETGVPQTARPLVGRRRRERALRKQWDRMETIER